MTAHTEVQLDPAEIGAAIAEYVLRKLESDLTVVDLEVSIQTDCGNVVNARVKLPVET